MTNSKPASTRPRREQRCVTYPVDLSADPCASLEHGISAMTSLRLAPHQPPEFTDFAGCTMHLNLDGLDCDVQRRRELLIAIGGRGARVPGTQFVLRVPRPWYALFEARQGDYSTLPNDWMEIVHVRKDGFHGRYEWVGRRHPQAKRIVRWSLYEETPSGWQLKPQPLPQLSPARLRNEVEHVLSEIDAFKSRLIPAIVARAPSVLTAIAEADEANRQAADAGHSREARPAA